MLDTNRKIASVTQQDPADAKLRAALLAVPGSKSQKEIEEESRLDIESENNDERAVRAASFLLWWAAGEGSEELEGVLALGLSRVLDRAADNMARTRRRNRKLR